jgi:UDP-glucose 4-epimerase
MESDAQGVFNVDYCKRINLLELADLIMEITGITVPLIHDPSRPGDVRDSLADITLAQKSFGYDPQYTVKTGIMETITWFRNQ